MQNPLPITFATFLDDQIKNRDLLFPAERSYYDRLQVLIERIGPELFNPLRALERKMGVTPKATLDQVDFLNRSPLYGEWRKAVADIFARLDPILDAEIAGRGKARLVIVLSPPEIPVGSERMWLRIRSHGKMIPLQPGGLQPHLETLLAAGQAKTYDRWIIEAGDAFKDVPGVVRLSYKRLDDYRESLMTQVQRLLEGEPMRSPRELAVRLKQMKAPAPYSDPIIADFARAVLLSGNGTLLINNTFVEWATIQAVRRARPSVSIISFGVRNKVKPFSSLLIYADQQAVTPIPTQMDPLGSYVDMEVFYQYIWQEFEKYPEYRRNTAYLFLGQGLEELLVIAPPDFPLLSLNKPTTYAHVMGLSREWMNL